MLQQLRVTISSCVMYSIIRGVKGHLSEESTGISGPGCHHFSTWAHLPMAPSESLEGHPQGLGPPATGEGGALGSWVS